MTYLQLINRNMYDSVYMTTLHICFCVFVLVLPTEGLGQREKETYKDVIEKAYNLSLQQDRYQALSVLVFAARREVKKDLRKSVVPKEIINAIEEIGHIFYSDKTQQLHELALSLKQNDPNAALAKLYEARRMEPDNLTLLLEAQRVLLVLNDCSEALKTGEKVLDYNPYSEEAKLHNAQAAICLGRLDSPLAALPQDINKRSPLVSYWQLIEIEKLYKQSKFDLAIEKVSILQKINPQFPEPLYWRLKIETEQKKKTEVLAHGYIAACRKLTPRQTRQFSLEPHLCRRVTEVENSLKKTHN